MHTKVSLESGERVLFVGGRVDQASAAELETVIGQHPADASGTMVIDLSEVDYLSSAGLKVFQGVAERTTQAGGRLLLRAPSVAARLALELSGMLALVGEEMGDQRP